LDRTDETGTTKRSVPLRPTTIAWRILRLVRSVNGIGRRTTSFLEQVIENVVGGIVPNLLEGLLQSRWAHRNENDRFLNGESALHNEEWTIPYSGKPNPNEKSSTPHRGKPAPNEEWIIPD